MRNFLIGALCMYLLSGAVVTTSLWVHTNDCTWVIVPYWVTTWLYHVVMTIFA